MEVRGIGRMVLHGTNMDIAGRDMARMWCTWVCCTVGEESGYDRCDGMRLGCERVARVRRTGPWSDKREWTSCACLTRNGRHMHVSRGEHSRRRYSKNVIRCYKDEKVLFQFDTFESCTGLAY